MIGIKITRTTLKQCNYYSIWVHTVNPVGKQCDNCEDQLQPSLSNMALMHISARYVNEKEYLTIAM